MSCNGKAGPMPAAHIGWERSRVSHHVRRMSARGLVACGPPAADRRVTEVALTGRGRQAVEDAAPGHVDLVRRLFFEGLPDGLVGPRSPEHTRTAAASRPDRRYLPGTPGKHPPPQTTITGTPVAAVSASADSGTRRRL
jgi:hypothetical protein